MDHTVAVGMLERSAHLGRNADDPLHVVWRPVVQAGALDHLHDDIWRAVLLSCVVDGDDVGVAESGDGLSLVQQAIAAFGAKAGARQHFDRHVSIQSVVMAAIHRAHATTAELFAQPVAIVEHRLF